MKFSVTPLAFHSAPPVLGQHTDEVLREVLGLSDAQIAALKAAKAV
jgi:crotonobetainyl-CoA:carnitine CoA-transferase CaiB-like acyl-CoA transferase